MMEKSMLEDRLSLLTFVYTALILSEKKDGEGQMGWKRKRLEENNSSSSASV